jgi:hypothetical protein
VFKDSRGQSNADRLGCVTALHSLLPVPSDICAGRNGGIQTSGKDSPESISPQDNASFSQISGIEVLQKTTDDRLLNTKWRMLAAGKLMSEQSRYVAIRDGVLNHMAHRRGQLTVYLRLNEETVPAIYGLSADEGK